jgi:Uma2 family endonuclease
VDSRHEFIDGDILAITGGTRRHAVLKSRPSARLTIGIGEGSAYHVEDSDTRVVVERGPKLNAYYPDMVVICGAGETHTRDPDGGVVNPRLIVEVTSPNTEKRDRGVKLDGYCLLPSLREYLIVSHLRRQLEIWSRDDAGVEGNASVWSRRVLTAGQSTTLEVGVALSVDELYRDPLPRR